MGTDNKMEDHNVISSKAPFPLCRHILAFMAFLGFVNVYALRVNLSVTLVAMVNSTGLQKNQNLSNECPGTNQTNNGTTRLREGEFSWNSDEQGLILGSFFYGYIFTQIPGGWLAERYGGKLLYGLGLLFTSLLTLVTPVAARAGIPLLVTCRILEGLSEGVIFPAMHAMLAKWSPPLERSKMGGFIYAGTHIGTVVSLLLSGWLCSLDFLGGWPLAFYLFGSLGCIWFIGWMFLVYDSPAKHPRISVAEREEIEKSIGHASIQVRSTPWMSIFTSVPFWALLMISICQSYAFYTLLTCLPTYVTSHIEISLLSASAKPGK